MSEAEKIAQWLDAFAKIHGINHDVWYDITNDIANSYKKLEKLNNFINNTPTNHISDGREEYFSQDIWEKMMKDRETALRVLKEYNII